MGHEDGTGHGRRRRGRVSSAGEQDEGAVVEAHFRRLLEAAPDAMVITDDAGVIVLVNHQVSALFGYRPDELIGQPVETLIPPRYRHAHPAHRAKYFIEPRRRPMGAGGLALFGLRKDGSEFPAEISLSPLESENNGTVAITAIRNISDRKRAEQQRARLARAQESIRMRDEFLSIASHELKTPLTALQLQTDALQRMFERAEGSEFAPHAQKRLDRMTRSIQRLTSHIEQLLDVSRITSGRLTMSRESVDLSVVTAAVTEEMGDAIQRADCSLRANIEPRVLVWGDPFRIQQIVNNLLSNAIKYGAGKTVEVSLVRQEQGIASLTVRDHGIGIAPEDQARIFERFERVVSARQYGGIGLGLWIVRQVIEAHGGSIEVWSEPGAGSTFTVELPCAEAVGIASDAPSPRQPAVLIVDDDEDVRDSIVDLLALEGIEAHGCGSGIAALQRLRDGMRPRVILLDLMMPDMDGWSFLDEQARDSAIAGVPVVLISAVTALEKEAAGLDVAGYLAKPVEASKLLSTLSPFAQA